MSPAASPFTAKSLVQYAMDSTSLSLLKECPYKYYLQIIQGWRSRAEAVALDFGIAIHQCLEKFHKALVELGDREEALKLAVRHALEYKSTYENGVFRPWETGDPNRNRRNLVLTIVWYENRYRLDHSKTVVLENGKAAAELSFRFEIGAATPEGIEYLLCGHLDRLVEFGEDTLVEDYKHTVNTLSSNYFNRYTPDNQMSTYSVAAKVIWPGPIGGVLVQGIQVGTTFAKFERGMATRSPGQLEEWLEDTIYWLRLAERYAADQRYPMNDKSCSLYGGCVFRKNVCSKDREVREIFLNRDFERRHWNPLEVR